MHRGQLRDPIAIREELHRRGLGAMMMWLEQVVASLDTTDRAAQGIVRRAGNRATGFDPGVIATLVAQQRISAEAVKTLGGEQLTVAMLTEADPAFTFDNVARRIARTRLMTLLAALARFANPDDPNAARASAGEPPERWLSRVVQLGLVPATMLVDPWGNPYQFRRVGAERAAIVVSERAPDYELASAGPDGRIGSGDDIRDPFARILPEARPYAVASGEDNLMKQLSALAPGPRVLMAMAQAYASVGREAREEAQRQVVTATASEATAQMAPPATAAPSPEPAPGMMDMATGGAGGRGGGAYAADSAGAMAEEEARERPAMRGRRSQNNAEGGEDQDGEGDDEGEPAENAQQGQQRTPGGSRLAVAGELVRERFPATLHFVGEVAIDAAGTAIVEVPLADALTTYRLEAIGWSASGWTVSARGHVRVDQDAMVDAPVPPFGTTGDVVRIPVRIANRTAQPLAARVEVAAEGGLRISGSEPRAVEVPPNDAIEVLTEVRLGDPAEGFLVIRAVRAGDGSPLDAVRRPMVVLPDARLVRETFQLLVETGTDVTVEVPAEATPRGAGELRVAVGSAIFGDASQWGREDPIWGSWTLVAGGERVPDELRAWSRATLAAGGEAEEIYGDPHTLAIAVATSWNDRAVRDADVRRGLRAVSRVLEGNEGDEPMPMPGPSAAAAIRDPGRIEMLSRVLIALSPAVGARGRTMARGDLDRLVNRLRTEVGSGAVAISDAPVLWATAAAALATTRKGRADARAEELLRRADRGVITVGDEAWLENESEAGRAWARVEPSAMLAIARAALGRRQDAMPLVRSLAGLARGAERWGGQVRALASVAVSSLSRGRARADARVTMDGRALQVRNESGVAVAVLGRIGQPGTHTIQVRVAEGQVALAWVDARWGMPWSTPPERAALIDLAIEGPVGARDTRAGMQLIVRNRGARLLTAPIVEIDMPAGTELDVSATTQLGAWTAAPPAVEGRVLRLRLRPLAPGARLVLPLPVRWSLGGTLRGLGASAWDDATAPSLRVRPTAVLPSRALDIPDRGSEPATPEAEVPEVPRPPEPPPPIDIMRAFEGDRSAAGRRTR